MLWEAVVGEFVGPLRPRSTTRTRETTQPAQAQEREIVTSFLVTGGCGFVGSTICREITRLDPLASVTAFDNLRRRGSEGNLASLEGLGVPVIHGDVRVATDLDEIAGEFDVIIDAAAEPSVHAGTSGSPRYVIDTNLSGTVNLLEFARRRAQTFILLSTSRVYSIGAMRALQTTEGPTRLELTERQTIPGASGKGISERFPTDGIRSFYGTSKLASEMLAQEYAASTDLQVIINRCGVIAGAGQFGKVDQGVVALWVAAHLYGRPLAYIGFGGSGKQVRDLMHPEDLLALVLRQLEMAPSINGEVFNVGGGRPVSVSLAELTVLCRERTGRAITIDAVADTSAVDIPVYPSDTTRVEETTGWQPRRTATDIIDDIATWIEGDYERLRPLFVSA